MNLDLVKTNELFLVPSSFLVAALGTADTNVHRAAVSALGLIVSVLWLVCSWEARAESATQQPAVARTARFQVLTWLGLLFLVGWLVSTIWHLALAGQPLGSLSSLTLRVSSFA
jgi:hypothetical protein